MYLRFYYLMFALGNINDVFENVIILIRYEILYSIRNQEIEIEQSRDATRDSGKRNGLIGLCFITALVDNSVYRSSSRPSAIVCGINGRQRIYKTEFRVNPQCDRCQHLASCYASERKREVNLSQFRTERRVIKNIMNSRVLLELAVLYLKW